MDNINENECAPDREIADDERLTAVDEKMDDENTKQLEHSKGDYNIAVEENKNIHKQGLLSPETMLVECDQTEKNKPIANENVPEDSKKVIVENLPKTDENLPGTNESSYQNCDNLHKSNDSLPENGKNLSKSNDSLAEDDKKSPNSSEDIPKPNENLDESNDDSIEQTKNSPKCDEHLHETNGNSLENLLNSNENSPKNNENLSEINAENLKVEVKINVHENMTMKYDMLEDFWQRKELLDKPITALKCPVCEKRVHPAQSLLDHIKTHISDIDKKYSCSICHALFKTNKELVTHKIDHKTEEHSFLCLECKVAFSDHLDWQLHSASHKTVQIYKCEECYKFFILKVVYKSHLEMHYDREIKCEKCSEVLKSDKLYKTHMEVHARTFECVECGKILRSKKEMDAHLYVHIGYRPHQCYYCGRGFYTKTSRDSHHKLVHIGDRPYQCRYCEMKFKATNDCAKHEKFKHGQLNKVECEICSKKIQHRYYKTHVKYMHGDEKFTCEFCEKIYSNAVSLKHHVIYSHTTARPYVCHICNDRFKMQHALNQHVKTHKNDRDIDFGMFER